MADDARTRLLNAPNLNHLWAGVVVEELVRNGVTTICVCPGSRSTPLTWAVADHPATKSVVHFDERGAAFHALGIAKSTGCPVAFVCTSGTAVANAFPAVVEASMAHVPLILLTADRPERLQDTGANQTIDQVKVFGDYTRWRFTLTETLVADLEALLTTVDYAVYRADLVPCGPVHLDFMFDEPLSPKRDSESVVGLWFGDPEVEAWLAESTPFTRYAAPRKELAAPEARTMASLLRNADDGFIVAGELRTREDREAVLKFADCLGWPIVADITSGLRIGDGSKMIAKHANLSGLPLSRDVVVHFGGAITSKSFLDALEDINLAREQPAHYIRIVNHPFRVDPLHRTTHRIEAEIPLCVDSITRVLGEEGKSTWFDPALNALLSRKVEECMSAFAARDQNINEITAAYILTRDAPRESVLFLGNSMPIRDADKYGAADGNGPLIAANRGASGIDGNIATAAGYARGLGKPVTAVIGDLAALHDLNSLALLEDLPAPVILVIINNDGGGIFHFLPIADHLEHFERFFATPHGLTFQAMAQGFGLDYYVPKTNGELMETYTEAHERSQSCIIEIRTDRKENVQLHRALDEKVRRALEDL